MRQLALKDGSPVGKTEKDGKVEGTSLGMDETLGGGVSSPSCSDGKAVGESVLDPLVIFPFPLPLLLLDGIIIMPLLVCCPPIMPLPPLLDEGSLVDMDASLLDG